MKNILKTFVISFLGMALFANLSFAKVSKVDSNFDGKMDQWHHSNEEGKLYKIEYDSDFDGTIDQVEHFKGEKKNVKS